MFTFFAFDAHDTCKLTHSRCPLARSWGLTRCPFVRTQGMGDMASTLTVDELRASAERLKLLSPGVVSGPGPLAEESSSTSLRSDVEECRSTIEVWLSDATDVSSASAHDDSDVSVASTLDSRESVLGHQSSLYRTLLQKEKLIWLLQKQISENALRDDGGTPRHLATIEVVDANNRTGEGMLLSLP